jgi:hypothetical protein
MQEYLFISFSIINKKETNIKVFILFFFTIIKYNNIFKGVNTNKTNIIINKAPIKLYFYLNKYKKRNNIIEKACLKKR